MKGIGQIRANERACGPRRNDRDEVEAELLGHVYGCPLSNRLRHDVRPGERIEAADEVDVGPRVLVDGAVGVGGGIEGDGGDAGGVDHAADRFRVGAGLQDPLHGGGDALQLHLLRLLLGPVERVGHVEDAAAALDRGGEGLRLVEVGVEDLQPLRRAGEIGDVAEVPLSLCRGNVKSIL